VGFVRIGRPWPRGPRMALMLQEGKKQWWSERQLEEYVASCTKMRTSSTGARKALETFKEYYEPKKAGWS
jgi:hypothetical protein